MKPNEGIINPKCAQDGEIKLQHKKQTLGV